MTFSDFIRLKDQQIESAKKLQKLDKHLTFVHEEVAKSIHIIDKHSVEMDDLTGKILGVQDFIEKQDENQDKQVLGNLQSHLNLIQTQVSEFKENFNKLACIPNQVEALKNQIKTVGEEIKIKESNRSTMEAPNPAPREKSPGVLKEIDDLKNAIADSQTGYRKLKRSFESYKKDSECEIKVVKENIEKYLEQISNVESNAQDLNSKISQLKSNLKIVVAEEVQNTKKNEQFEQKLKNIKELLVSYDLTFKQILESLSMNQMSINDLRNSLADTSSRNI